MHPRIAESIAAAEADIGHLKQAKTPQDARRAWESFLENSNRAINRLEGYSRRAGETPVYKALLQAIWAHPVASYMRTARNLAEHGVEDLTVAAPNEERMVFPNGWIVGHPIVYAKTASGEEIVMTAQEPAEYFGDLAVSIVRLPPGVRLMAVRAKNGSLLPPPRVQPLSVDEPEAAAMARAYLAWIRQELVAFGWPSPT